MNRWIPLLFKAILFLLVVAILGTGVAIARFAMFDDKLNAPRTELERAHLLAIQAVKSNPNDDKARIKLASVYLEMGRISKAVAEAKIATRLAPDNAEAFYVLGLAHKEKGNFTQATQSLEKAANTKGQLGAFYQTCWAEVGRVHMERKDYKKAIKDFDKALGFGPEAAPILYDLGRAYELSGDTKKALIYYNEVLEFVPDYEDAMKGATRLEKKQAAQASTTAKPAPAAKGSK